MASTDSVFAGSIPDIYDRNLGPLLFEPYALDMAKRVASLQPARILETAAGTGIVTAAMLRALPAADIVATDLSPAMLAVASGRVAGPNVRFEPADAQSLPFPDAAFDVVVCQFGVMFFPDKVGAYSEALRVLRPGGRFLFSVWDRLDANPVSDIVATAVGRLFPHDPPSFLERVPFGYHDRTRIDAELREAGFVDVEVEPVALDSTVTSARDAAVGLCHGAPLRGEIEQRDPGRLEEAAEAAAEALRSAGYDTGAVSPLSALVVDARRRTSPSEA